MVSLDYPPLAGGGYGVMAGQVCAWLRRQGHALLVLAAGDPVARTGRTAPAAVDGVPVRWTLHSYWDGENCRYPPFREALAIEQANHAQLQQALADLHPDVVTFWHMGALSLGLITATAHLSLPLVWTAGTLERDMPWPGRLSGSGWPSSVVPAPAVASSSLCSGRSNCPRGASMPTR